MFKTIKKNLYFFIPYLIFFIVSSFVLIMFSKKSIHLFINGFYSDFGDLFFKYYTHVGDGIFITLLIIALLFVKYRYSIILIFSTLSSTLVVQAFKRFILPDIARPILYFQNQESLHFVKDIYINRNHSFPSGHTTSAFTMFLFLALITKNKYLKLLFFILAFTVGYSRIYLSHHFLVDVYVGSIIGIILTLFFYNWVNKWNNPKLDLSINRKLQKNT